MCYQNNLKDQSVTTLDLNDLFVTKITKRINLLQTSNLKDP